MSKIKYSKLAPGLYWVEVPEVGFRVLCGCPPDSVKFLIQERHIRRCKEGWEMGPSAILLNDLPIQNSSLCNLGEFPILQIFYRQGYFIPGHVNYGLKKPVLMGTKSQVFSQLDYFYRGNYGLDDETELSSENLPAHLEKQIRATKDHFAFNQKIKAEDLLELRLLDQDPCQNIQGVTVERLEMNHYKFTYGEDTYEINLNLLPDQCLISPLCYERVSIPFLYKNFSIVNIGEGDGWDVDRSSMGSLLQVEGRYYLVDAGPHLVHSLSALGIALEQIDGVFQTHAHDDHFAGLPALLRSCEVVPIFATSWVYASVIKKLAALLRLPEEQLKPLFPHQNLNAGEWNSLSFLEVKPCFSPHPIETTIFYFRKKVHQEWKTYGHLADICSLKVLEGIVEKKVLTPEEAAVVKSDYLMQADIKKIDIGGGLIHGQAEDFIDDQTPVKFLAHTSLTLTDVDRKVGRTGRFGSVYSLDDASFDHTKHIQRFMDRYYQIHPGQIQYESIEVIPYGDPVPSLSMVLDGVVEAVSDNHPERTKRVFTGTILCLAYECLKEVSPYQYKAESDTRIVRFDKQQLLDWIKPDQESTLVRFYQLYHKLCTNQLLKGVVAGIHLFNSFKPAVEKSYRAGETIVFRNELICVIKGQLECSSGRKINENEFYGCLVVAGCSEAITVVADSELIVMPAKSALLCPLLYWRVVEEHLRLRELKASQLA